MKKNSYMDRAMRCSDPRFARILARLGYRGRDMRAETPAPAPKDDIAELRAEYLAVIGKKPFMGWKEDVLREKIAAARGAAE